MKRVIFFSVLIALILINVACQPAQPEQPERLLATVFNKSLYLSELEGMFPENTTSQDSTLIIQAYTNRWVKEAVLLHEAERNVPSDLNIDKLVRDYRASLLRQNYEEVMVRELLDSAITQKELEDFYEANKNQYQLETTIIRCYFIKIPLPVKDETNLRRWWQNPGRGDNFDQLVEYCNLHAQAHHLVDSTWQRLEDIAIELPNGTLTSSNVNSQKEVTLKDDKFLYFFRSFAIKNKKEIAPLGYIQDQARKFILHKRKVKLLEEKKDIMLDLALEKKNVEIFY